jgi:hypothetical protein
MKVKDKIYKEHVMYQLPSPFTGYVNNQPNINNNIPFSVKQVA